MNAKINFNENVQVRTRRFIQDENGDEEINGVRGRYTDWVEGKPTKNLITNTGFDFLLNQMYGISGLGSVGAVYGALSTDSTGPDATDTELTGELSSNGFSRAIMVSAHTTGTKVITLTKRWTATGDQSSIQKGAIFTAESGGTMVNEFLLDAVYTLKTYDQIELRFTMTVGES